ncbi:MAG: transglycosylase domain-containing protein [Sediminibacterium sp.]|nr:transglycosylase domain-containing protein [Sediminibacterium sp.]MBP6145384.1 transglycosylase domain-containing protein [Sediminibacterium sp.]
MLNFGWIGDMPDLDDIENPTASLASQVYAQDGTPMGKFYLEDRISVKYRDISPYLLQALVATEDKRFYDHYGIDGEGLLRAVAFLGSQGGASTITMQTAKNLFTDNWGTKNKLLRIIQKIKESIIAIKLERSFTKQEILTLYLNTVPFSENIFGVSNASRTFFQKEPDRITIEEAALLIGMINGPGKYNPNRNPKLALERRNLVLNRMAGQKYISTAQAEQLKALPLVTNFKKLDENNGLGPYFRSYLGEYMKKWCKEHKKNNGDAYNLYRDGLKIYTTINPRMQLYAEEAVGRHMAYLQKEFNKQANIKTGSVWKDFNNQLELAIKQTDRWRNMKREDLEETEIRKSFDETLPMRVFAWNKNRFIDTIMTPLDSLKYHKQMLQTGFLAVDPFTGEVKAWVGGIDFKTFKYDHVNINTRRQVGSTMKPLLYSLAIEKSGFTPFSIVQDQQQNFEGYGMVPNTPKSCTGQSMPMAQALAESRNCATAYIMKQINGDGNEAAKELVAYLKKVNIQADIPAYPSIALGACEVSLFEMVQAYTMFPGGGYNAQPFFINRIEDKNGNVLESFSPQRRKVISELTAYSMVSMMEGVISKGTGRSMYSYDIGTQAVAGKTGTTNDNSDLWFMGYTPQILAGAWVGADDRYIRFTDNYFGQGAHGSLPIWAYFMNKVANDPACNLDRNASFVRPDNLSTDFNVNFVGKDSSVDLTLPDQDAEAIEAESDYSLISNNEPTVVTPATNPAANKPAAPKKTTTEPKQASTPANKPKAVMPKKKQ